MQYLNLLPEMKWHIWDCEAETPIADMATWFKAAEGLLEAVDRTAKQASGKDSSDFLRSDSLSASGNTTRKRIYSQVILI